jgi:signal transduction histidine kinase
MVRGTGKTMKRRSKAAGEPVKTRRRKPASPKRQKAARPSSITQSNTTIGHLTRERDQLLEQQTATANLLGIISRSKFDLQPVLQTVVDTAVRLCHATSGEIFRLDKGVYRFEVGCNLDPRYVKRQKPIAPGPGTMVGRTAMSRHVEKIDDLLSDPSYTLKEDAKIGGARSMIGVPLMREGEPIGVIILSRHRVEPFNEREIKVVTAFADQAVIAIGARERESQMARQARSAEQALELLAGVSKAASSATDLHSLALDCLAQSGKAAGCQFGQLWTPEPDGDLIRCMAKDYFGDRFAEFHSWSVQRSWNKEDKSISAVVWQNRAPLWAEDLASLSDFVGVEKAKAAGFKSSLTVPITIDDDVFAIFEMYSTYVLPSNQTMMAAVAKLGRLLGDILVRKRSDLALRAAHSELARVSQFSAMGVMTASIGHEIRQPLAAIVTGAHAGLRWISRSPPNVDEAKQTLKNIVQEGQRASDILDTIRAMFKRDSKETVPIDINSLIADVLELVQSEVRKQKVSIETKLADRLPEVSGNRIQLQQVVLNLTMNAIEAMSALNGRERILRLKTAVHRPDGVLVTVEDSGPGIDAKDVERIFDALFTTKSKGMGMGLSICRSIIEAYHGRLWVSPGKEHGSAFHFVLPAMAAEAA